MLEKERTQAAFAEKANNDKTELAGLLHQIKTQLMEKGLVSGEELEQYKAKITALGCEVDKLKKELVKRNEADLNLKNLQKKQKDQQ